MADKNYRMTFEMSDGTRQSVLFTAPQGESGVYVGSGEMPDGYNVQIDPAGETDSLQTAIAEYLAENPLPVPERGVDYYTEEDKAEIVESVLAAIPDGDEVAY